MDKDNVLGYEDGHVLVSGITGYEVAVYRVKRNKQTGDMVSKMEVNVSKYSSRDEKVVRIEPDPVVDPSTPGDDPVTPPEGDPVTPPDENPSQEEPPADTPPAEEPPAETPPADDPSAEEPSAEETAAPDAPEDDGNTDADIPCRRMLQPATHLRTQHNTTESTDAVCQTAFSGLRQTVYFYFLENTTDDN